MLKPRGRNMLTIEMLEILRYLHHKKKYAIFGGFAAFLHTGVSSSQDIDVFVADASDLENIAEHFFSKGWKVIKKGICCGNHKFVSLRKHDTTFDVHWSKLSAKILMVGVITKQFKELNLRVLGVEQMFLCKLQVVIERNRSAVKIKRDLRTINELRLRLNDHKLNQLLRKLPPEFWSKGYF